MRSRLIRTSARLAGVPVPSMTIAPRISVSGGAGAPYYAQERDVPWADRVAFFDPRQHYLRFDVDGAKVELVVIGVVGEEIERVTLTR